MSELSGARDGEFDVVEFFRYVRRRWRTVAVVVGVGAGIGLAGVAAQLAVGEVHPTVVTVAFTLRANASAGPDVPLYQGLFRQPLVDEATKRVTSPVSATFTGALPAGLTLTVSSFDTGSATSVAEWIVLEAKRLAEPLSLRRAEMERSRAALSSVIDARRPTVDVADRIASDEATVAFLQKMPGQDAARELLLARLRLHLMQLTKKRAETMAAAAERARDILDRTPNERGVPPEVSSALAELQRTGGFRVPEPKSDTFADVLVASPPTTVVGDAPRSFTRSGTAGLAAGGATGMTVALAFLLLAFTKQMTAKPQG